MKKLCIVSGLCTFFVWVVCLPLYAGQTTDSLSDDEQAIRETYSRWVVATNARDIDSWSSFLAPGARFLPPNSPLLTSEGEIRNFYLQLFKDERFHLDCRQDQIEISGSGDTAWSFGHCEATFTDPGGNESHGQSKWVKVWRRMPNGEWKCAVNSWNSTNED